MLRESVARSIEDLRQGRTDRQELSDVFDARQAARVMPDEGLGSWKSVAR